MWDSGKLKAGESFRQYSLIDSVFTCTCTEETKQGETPAMVPQIGGQAWRTANTTYFRSETDPLGTGFLLV